MNALLGLAACLAALVLAFRALRSRAAERARPGRSPEAPIRVEDYADIDAAIAREACRCGGRLLLRGEGPVPGSAALRVAQLACRKCERAQRLYFDLSGVRH